jgi:phosphate:Na+ symporter
MGANIGTTFSSQLIAFDIGQYAAIPLFIGLLLSMLGKTERLQNYGNFLLYFGMLFFGLFVMQESVDPLRNSPVFENWIKRIDENYIQGSLIGGLVTLIIQSSSGTVGIAIVLGKQNLITVAGGIAIMLGAELGTCSDTLLATIKGTRQALKAGVFHLLFNFMTILIGLIVFDPFVDLVELISKEADIGRKIANAHVLFNVGGVLLLLPFVSLIERFLNWMIKEKAEPQA